MNLYENENEQNQVDNSSPPTDEVDDYLSGAGYGYRATTTKETTQTPSDPVADEVADYLSQTGYGYRGKL